MKRFIRHLKFRTWILWTLFKHLFLCKKGDADPIGSLIGIYFSGIPGGLACEECKFHLYCDFKDIKSILKNQPE